MDIHEIVLLPFYSIGHTHCQIHAIKDTSLSVKDNMNPRHHSQIDRALNILEKSGAVELLKDNQYLLFLFKKSERIAVALFIVTGFLSDNEPLKWGLRDAAYTLIKDILSYREFAGTARGVADAFLGSIARTLSLLNIGYISDAISPMNFSVLKKELDGLFAILDGRVRIGNPSSPALFDEQFFAVSKELSADAKAAGEYRGAPKQGHPSTPPAASINVVSRQKDGVAEKKEQPAAGILRIQRGVKDTDKGHRPIPIKDNVLYETKKPSPKKSKEKSGASTQQTSKGQIARLVADRIKEERKQVIVTVVRKRGVATLKDFIGIIQGCSGKTIQRLLLELVEEDVLKKEGERRWSRYAFIQPVPAAPSTSSGATSVS